MKQLFYNIILWIFSFLQTHWKLTGMHFYVFVESSTCVHKVMEYADDVSKLHDFSSYVLLGVYISLNF